MTPALLRRLRSASAQAAVLLLLGSVALVYFYVTYVYRPALAPAAAMRAHVLDLQASNEQVRGSIAAYGLPRLKARIAAYQAMRGDLDRLIPPSDSVLDVLGMLDRAAQQAGVELTGVHPDSSSVLGTYAKRGWSITAVGAAERIGTFLTLLASQDHIVRPQHLMLAPAARTTVTAAHAKDPRAVVQASFSLETVWHAAALDTVPLTSGRPVVGGMPGTGLLAPVFTVAPADTASRPAASPRRLGGYSPIDTARTP